MANRLAGDPVIGRVEYSYEYAAWSECSETKPRQDDVLRATVSDDLTSVVIIDGMSNLSSHFPDEFRYLAFMGLSQMQRPLSTSALTSVLLTMHEQAEQRGIGAAAALIQLRSNGTCRFAVCGDIALWADRGVAGNPQWEVLNATTPHDNRGGDQRLAHFIGREDRQPPIHAMELPRARSIIGMTDGWYQRQPNQQLSASGWHPKEPHLVGAFYSSETPFKWLQDAMPGYRDRLDNFSAFCVRGRERRVRQGADSNADHRGLNAGLAAVSIALAAATTILAFYQWLT